MGYLRGTSNCSFRNLCGTSGHDFCCNLRSTCADLRGSSVCSCRNLRGTSGHDLCFNLRSTCADLHGSSVCSCRNLCGTSGHDLCCILCSTCADLRGSSICSCRNLRRTNNNLRSCTRLDLRRASGFVLRISIVAQWLMPRLPAVRCALVWRTIVLTSELRKFEHVRQSR